MFVGFFRFQKEIDGYWRLHSLRGNIKNSLNLKNGDTVLKFHDLITREMCQRTLNKNPQIQITEMRYQNVQGLDWPCTPRPKPLAINDSTHDLPNFNEFTCKFFAMPELTEFYFNYLQLITTSSIGRKRAELPHRSIAIWCYGVHRLLATAIKPLKSSNWATSNHSHLIRLAMNWHLALPTYPASINCKY